MSGQKKDGSGTWYARELVLECNDGNMYPDEFIVRVTGAVAQSDSLATGNCYLADISFSTRAYNGRVYQDLYLRSLTPSPSKGEGDSGMPY